MNANIINKHFSQIPLDLWNTSYDDDWFVGECNLYATNLIFNQTGQILLCGPSFSGKKHLAWQAAKKAEEGARFRIFFINLMSNEQIIAEYDKQKIIDQENSNAKAIWINTESIKGVYEHPSLLERIVPDDITSRLNSMLKAEITQLSEDIIENLLNARLSGLGYEVRNEIIAYCIKRMPITYEAVEACVEYVKSNNKMQFSMFKEFFAKNFN